MNLSLRKWQKEALPIWWKSKKGIVKVVTGGGKTFFAIKCINDYLEKYPEKKILIIVPSIALLDQWSIEISNLLDVNPSINGGGSNIANIGKINITTINSLKKIYKKIAGEKFFLIADECHRIGTKNCSKMLKKNWHAAIGLSATPERDFDDSFKKIIVPVLGKVIYDYNYIDAKKDKVISNFSLINAYAPMLHDEEENYSKLTKKIAKRIANVGTDAINDNILKNLLFKRARLVGGSFNRIPTALNLIKSLKRKKWIIFSETKKQANLMNSLLNKSNFSSAIYNSDESKVYRVKNLQEFRDGILDCLVTCKALDEGFDLPEIDSAIILSSSSTSRQRIQRLGRSLRTAKNKTDALIITIYSSDNEYNRLEKECDIFSREGISVEWTKLKISTS